MDLNDYVKFDDSCKQFEIVTGTQGKYSYDDVTRVSVLNEKAKYKGKGIPFTAVLPGGPLPSGLFQNPYLYVGVKIVLKNDTVVAVYVSKEKTMVNTDQYIQDRKIAKKIEEVWYMTDEQRKMIDKLNEDNRKLNDVNKGMKDYAKYKLVVGILVVIIIIVLYFIQHTT